MHSQVLGLETLAVLLILFTTDLLFSLLIFFFFLLVITGLIRAIARKPEITDHWYHLFENVQILDYLISKN